MNVPRDPVQSVRRRSGSPIAWRVSYLCFLRSVYFRCKARESEAKE